MGREIVVENVLYAASAAPIVKTYWNNHFDTGKDLDFFLVKPIVEYRYFLGLFGGRSQIVGYVEAVTGEKVCETVNHYSEYGSLICSVNYDAVSHNIGLGNVSWKVNTTSTADTLLDRSVIDEYMGSDVVEMHERIASVREQCKDVIRVGSIEEAVRRR